LNIFEKRESEVRSYCRTFDTVFTTASGATLENEEGASFIDFFAGAGTLNYGHNPPEMRMALMAYLEKGGVVHSLDMFTEAKRTFIETFEDVILAPRGMDHKLMFTGPTGTNAVEAALKLARKVTGRTRIVSFTNGFHGMTLGSLAVTGNSGKRNGAGVPLDNVSTMPYDGFVGNSFEILSHYLGDSSSGLDKPAAIILETVQGEGGINVASFSWLQEIEALAKKNDILLIVDDIQMGCGRTGSFFSFDEAGIVPDIITLSKSLSGFGLPFAITLLKPELDVWSPGEHNGTFRGHNLAFVTATEALNNYWRDDALKSEIERKGEMVSSRLESLRNRYPVFSFRGRGLVWGLEFGEDEIAGALSKQAFANGLIGETAGSRDQVFKIMPPLTIEDELLEKGLDILEQSFLEVCDRMHDHALASV